MPGPAGGLPDTKVGTFTQALTTGEEDGWTIISMKNDWKRSLPSSSEQLHGRK
jgi:hypothetical protein